MADGVKGKLQIYEPNVQMVVRVEFIDLLYHRTNGRDVVCCEAVRHKSSLLGMMCAPDGCERTSEQDPCEKPARDGEKGDVSVADMRQRAGHHYVSRRVG